MSEPSASLGDSLLTRMGRTMNPGLARTFSFMGLDQPEVRARGAWVEDASGARFLDLSSGYGVHVAGYMHPKLVATAVETLTQRMALSSRVLLSEPAVVLAERLRDLTPGDLTYTFFVNSGTEAVEAALKFARISTGRSHLVATSGAFHGKTIGALSVSGREVYRKPFAPLLADVLHVPFGDADAMERVVTRQTAAVIVEPIQGEGGVVVPPDGYLRRVREICDRAGARMIADEIQTGLGRTGTLWAVEHEGVVPDYLCVAKGLGGGLIPIGAVVGRPEAMEFFDQMPLIHTSTFGGGPLACTVAVATLDLITAEKLPDRARALGVIAYERLRSIHARYPEVIADVRGRGLMLGIEMQAEGLAGMVMSALFERHVLAVHTLNNERVLRFLPPLVIEESDLRLGLDAIEGAVAETAPLAEELAREGTEESSDIEVQGSEHAHA